MSTSNQHHEPEEFRDKIATVDESGQRIWIYPKKPSGKFYKYRTYLSWFFLLILFSLPLIKINGEPIVLFNIIDRNFIIFGAHFGPQDFYLFAIGMLILLVFIILFTVIFGRLFCGWICPQTIFMEMVFRKIEYWIEGDYNAQKRLDKAAWSANKIIKKVSKQIIFFVISVLIANIFLSYIIGFDDVKKIAFEPIALHLSGFISLIIFSFIFYFVFAKLREQVCTTICPYGRLQGVILDNKSLVVAYDFIRGEPRGKIQKNRNEVVENKEACKNACAGCKAGLGNSCHDDDEKPLSDFKVSKKDYLTTIQNKLGDCIDCKLCIHVCPTGIDIRDGTQLECINCTACMDACDEVMEKIHRPKGLIRIDSIDGIEQRNRKILNGRTYAYSAVLLILILVEIIFFSLRDDVGVLMLRTPGMLYQESDEGYINNLYNYKLSNKTSKIIELEFRLINTQGEIEIVGGKKPKVEKNSNSEGALFIKISKENLESRKNNILIGLYSEGKLISKVKTTFFGPIK